MRIPTGMTEAEVIEIAKAVIGRLAQSFVSSFHTLADIEQDGMVYACEAMEAYDDNKGPLEPFLYIHIRNQYISFRRKHIRDDRKPCFGCPAYDAANRTCSAFASRMDCELYAAWKARNESRYRLQNFQTAGPDDIIEHPSQAKLTDEIAFRDEIRSIQDSLPLKVRSDFLRLLDGIALPKARRVRVQRAVTKILNERKELQERSI